MIEQETTCKKMVDGCRFPCPNQKQSLHASLVNMCDMIKCVAVSHFYTNNEAEESTTTTHENRSQPTKPLSETKASKPPIGSLNNTA